uniref:Transmembrane protein n=1 Tax=viral metagenome TaxID=1070528 RepID=A0A6M3LS67_9ZZZZ
MSNQSTGQASGIGFAGMLTILFIGLKLGGVIDWAWAWVLSPLWGGAVLVVVFVVAFVIIDVKERGGR